MTLSKASQLMALAERCEQASGPSYSLEQEIARAIDWPTIVPKPFTASLDAAMTLVPESADSGGERFRLEQWNSNGVHAPHVRASAWVADAPRVYAATPALALTAAALRAHALLDKEPQDV